RPGADRPQEPARARRGLLGPPEARRCADARQFSLRSRYWDLVHAPGLAQADVASVRKLAYAGAPMLPPLAEACAKAFRPEVFVNHSGSTEIYTFSVCPDVRSEERRVGKECRW